MNATLRTTARLLIAAATAFTIVTSGVPAVAKAEPAVQTTVFRNVNVVPMDRERVIKGVDVLVQDGRVASVGKRLNLPAGAVIVDGQGTAYLSPGLADMHVHSDTRNDLAIYLSHGVTTILNMGEARNGFVARTRSAANQGAIPAPHVYVAFLVDGSPRYGHVAVTDPEDARALVRIAKANGYDFIKVYNNLSAACFDALLDEGRKRGLPVVGHGVTAVGLGRQLAAGQLLVAHAEEFLYTVFFPADLDVGTAAPRLDQIPGVVAAIKRSGAYVTADLLTYATISAQFGRPGVATSFLKDQDARLLAPEDRIAWRREDYARRTGSLTERLAFLRAFIKAMSDAGVPLVTGTDAPAIPGLFPGTSVHADLTMLEAAGLSRYRAFAAATRAPGELMHRAKPNDDRFGIIAPGYRADLILSRTNPLIDLDSLRRPLGVMASGRWYPASRLLAIREAVEASFREALTTP